MSIAVAAGRMMLGSADGYDSDDTRPSAQASRPGRFGRRSLRVLKTRWGKRALAAGAAILVLAVAAFCAEAWTTHRLQASVGSAITAVHRSQVEGLRLWGDARKRDALGVSTNKHVLASAIASLDAAEPHERSRALAELESHLEDAAALEAVNGFLLVDLAGNGYAFTGHVQELGVDLLKQPAFLEARRGVVTMSEPFSLKGARPSGFGDDRPSMFTFAPIQRQNGQQIGVLGFRLDPAGELSQLLALGRLGNTGESFAFDRAGTMVSSSRFASQLRRAGLIQASGILEVELKDPGKVVESLADVAADQPLTKPVRSVLAGKDGQDLDGWRDYRGHEEVGSWTWIPELRVGVVTEEDRSEAYSIIAITHWVAIGLIAVVLGAGAVVIVFSLFAMKLESKAAAVVALGQYTIGKKIGQGGMGTVYQAQHALLARPTAVKLLKPITPEAMQRFEREVQLTAKLTHPNTIAIYDYGVDSDGTFYYAMEYLEGTDLERLVKLSGPLPIARALHIVEQVLGSLAEAHDAGLVHRDIKPANIMLTRRGGIPDFVKVLDFGLARPVEDGASKVTAEQTIIGTPLYMAPETFTSAGAASPRSDVYSVAALLYYLLSGCDAFEGPTLGAIITRHTQGNPRPLADVIPGGHVPRELSQLLETWMAREAGVRPANAWDALTELEPLAIRYPWSQRDSRAAVGELGQASTVIVHAGMVATR